MRVLEAKDISFAYPGQPAVLQNIDLQVKSDERLAIHAPSGRGKTTLCKLLAGYLPPDQGTILLDGKPLPPKGKSPIQLIGQHPENAIDPRIRLRSTLEEAGDIDAQLLEQLGIRKEWLSRYPHELSGGELQRFCIARALMVKPTFIIADEISTMLDAITQVQIWELLLSATKKTETGMILVTHSPALSKRIATRTVTL